MAQPIYSDEAFIRFAADATDNLPVFVFDIIQGSQFSKETRAMIAGETAAWVKDHRTALQTKYGYRMVFNFDMSRKLQETT